MAESLKHKNRFQFDDDYELTNMDVHRIKLWQIKEKQILITKHRNMLYEKHKQILKSKLAVK